MQVRIKRGKKQLSSTMTRFNWQCLKDRLNKVYMKKLSHRALSVIRRYDRFERDPIFTSRLLPWALSHILCSKLLKFSHCTYIFFWEFELAIKFEFKVLSRDFRFSKKIIEMKSELMNSLLPQNSRLYSLTFQTKMKHKFHSFLISLFFTNFFCHHHSQFLLASLSLNFFHHRRVHILLIIYLPCATTHINNNTHFIHAKKSLYFHVIC